jgi:predicted small lipoprotein YifL
MINTKRLALLLVWIPAFAGMTMVSGCGLKGKLKSPSQIEAEDAKKARKEQKEQEKKQKEETK